jgi:hypothetical protein
MDDLREKISPEELTGQRLGVAADQGHEAWKQEKIKAALKQSDCGLRLALYDRLSHRFGGRSRYQRKLYPPQQPEH